VTTTVFSLFVEEYRITRWPPVAREVAKVPFHKQAMASLTIDVIIDNQAFQNGRCYICFSLGLVEKVKTGHNLLMEIKCLNSQIHTGLLAGRLFLLFGATLHWHLRKSRFVIKFCGKLADQPGSARKQRFDAGWLHILFPFFFNLAEKNLLIVKCRLFKIASETRIPLCSQIEFRLKKKKKENNSCT